MRISNAVIALFLVTLAPAARAQPDTWTTAAGHVSLSIPEAWSSWEDEDGYDLVLEAYDDDDRPLLGCYIKTSEIANPSGATQADYNQSTTSRTAESIAARTGGAKILDQSHTLVSGVDVFRFTLQTQEERGKEETTHVQFGVVTDTRIHAVAMSCAGPSPMPVATRKAIDALLNSLKIKSN